MPARLFPMRPWAHAGMMVLALAVTASLHAQALQVGTLRIESTPSAAEVELISGRAGVTPLTVNERDIYPNSYPDARADRYGTVTLRHANCEPLHHRVTLDDLKQGLHLRLACTAAAPAPPARPAPAAVSTDRLPPVPAPTMPQRRLRQLQVLQELLDEGLISPAEEQRVRRRILQLGDDTKD
ncbi:hypothetical protein RHOFW104T7_00310 [Rhodanobacter thiooxydans]|uniref:PEGA domain-containing protein n=1 Tax=Rhodanobacter thiooxydans TaxID=416169 RepID=A0A154QE61_9GAMM|nr:SHOCT domain-containing protein [Rhodanobacter thiooxydans]EIM02941.1 hypothetical protein UUA_00545 [Rhodanobacter thiooxydans LCS2]KZC22512.1 hypothetical protein RHOFW104T7_00310 [Rhodanobacter thiooxydans]